MCQRSLSCYLAIFSTQNRDDFKRYPTLPKTKMVPLKIGQGPQKEIISRSPVLVFFFSEANGKKTFCRIFRRPRNKGMVPKYSFKTLDFFLAPHLFSREFPGSFGTLPKPR